MQTLKPSADAVRLFNSAPKQAKIDHWQKFLKASLGSDYATLTHPTPEEDLIALTESLKFAGIIDAQQTKIIIRFYVNYFLMPLEYPKKPELLAQMRALTQSGLFSYYNYPNAASLPWARVCLHMNKQNPKFLTPDLSKGLESMEISRSDENACLARSISEEAPVLYFPGILESSSCRRMQWAFIIAVQNRDFKTIGNLFSRIANLPESNRLAHQMLSPQIGEKILQLAVSAQETEVIISLFNSVLPLSTAENIIRNELLNFTVNDLIKSGQTPTVQYLLDTAKKTSNPTQTILSILTDMEARLASPFKNLEMCKVLYDTVQSIFPNPNAHDLLQKMLFMHCTYAYDYNFETSIKHPGQGMRFLIENAKALPDAKEVLRKMILQSNFVKGLIVEDNPNDLIYLLETVNTLRQPHALLRDMILHNKAEVLALALAKNRTQIIDILRGAVQTLPDSDAVIAKLREYIPSLPLDTASAAASGMRP